jgi:hypothetical protein
MADPKSLSAQLCGCIIFVDRHGGKAASLMGCANLYDVMVVCASI